jgi:hypothetical protein
MEQEALDISSQRSAKKDIFPLFDINRTKMNDHLDQIVEKLLDRELIFLIGAGMSKSSKVPIGYEISNSLLKHYFSGIKDDEAEIQRIMQKFPFECIVEAIQEFSAGKRDDIRDFLNKRITDSIKPEKGHTALCEICNTLRGEPLRGEPLINRIYTTNFDMLIEKALGMNCCVTVSSNNTNILYKTPKGKLPVIHLHGTLNDDDFLITESDLQYEQQSGYYELLYDHFMSDFKDKIFVFVGYSMRDPDITKIFFSIRDQMIKKMRRRKKETYIIDKFADNDGQIFTISEIVWKNRGATLIPADAHEFFVEISKRLRSKEKFLKQSVMEKRSWTEEVLENKIEIILDSLPEYSTKIDALRFLLHTKEIEDA